MTAKEKKQKRMFNVCYLTHMNLLFLVLLDEEKPSSARENDQHHETVNGDSINRNDDSVDRYGDSVDQNSGVVNSGSIGENGSAMNCDRIHDGHPDGC